MPHDVVSNLTRWTASPVGRVVGKLAMVGAVAAGMLWWTSANQASDDAAASERLVRLEAQNDALRTDSQRLRDEVSQLGYQNEILHWQLRYTEQSLRQARDGLAEAEAAPEEPRPVRRAARRPTPAPTQAVVVNAERIDVAAADDSAGDDGRADSADALSEGITRRFRLDDGDIDVPELTDDYDAFARTRANAMWQEVVDEAVGGECGRNLSSAAGYKCSRELQRELWPARSVAVECILSGNAVPDYVAGDLQAADLPNNSLLLSHGAIILCDRGLQNLRR